MWPLTMLDERRLGEARRGALVAVSKSASLDGCVEKAPVSVASRLHTMHPEFDGRCEDAVLESTLLDGCVLRRRRCRWLYVVHPELPKLLQRSGVRTSCEKSPSRFSGTRVFGAYARAPVSASCSWCVRARTPRASEVDAQNTQRFLSFWDDSAA